MSLSYSFFRYLYVALSLVLFPSVAFAHGDAWVFLIMLILPVMVLTAIFLPFYIMAWIKKISTGSITKKIFQGIIALTFSIILLFGVFIGVFFMLYLTRDNVTHFNFWLVGLFLISIFLITKGINYLANISVQIARKIVK